MEASGQLHALAALIPGKEPPVPITFISLFLCMCCTVYLLPILTYIYLHKFCCLLLFMQLFICLLIYFLV
jgi:hypothetical protein